MPDQQTIAVLNRLLSAEYGSLIHRLAESNTFTKLASSEDRALLQRMIADTRSRIDRLARLIHDLRGAPVPRNYATPVSVFHYLELPYVIPQIFASQKELVRIYEGVKAEHPAASRLIAEGLASHRHRLSELQRMHQTLAVPNMRN